MSRKFEDDQNPFAAPASDLAPEQFSDNRAAFVYAGFWVRFVAAFVDGIITGILGGVMGGILGVILASMQLGPDKSVAGVIIVQICGQILGWLYAALQESSEARATVGKRLMGLRVVDLAGNRISFGRATGRYFAKIPSSLILGIGFLMQPFTERKQALHDIMAGTLVVKS